MRRHQVRPYGQSINSSRTLSLLMSLALIWMLYSWVRQPATWAWLAENNDEPVHVANIPHVEVTPGAIPAGVKEEKENIVPGPNDLDPAQMKEFKAKLELLTDRAPLRIREMGLYWKLMEWSRTEPFKKLESRADATSAFAQLWDQPARYRGKLIRLRMHVRRVLVDTDPENDLGLKKVYNIWGWTEDSKSFPYVVIVPELPPGLRVGPDVRGEVVFVGYFFKIFPYEAFDVARGAPMLIGRVRAASRPVAAEPINSPTTWILVASFVGIAILGGIAISYLITFRRPPRPTMLPDSMVSLEAFPARVGHELPVTYDSDDETSDSRAGNDSASSGWLPDRS
jgi:hypothetical protein